MNRYYPRISSSAHVEVLALRLIFTEYETPDDTACAVQRAVLQERAVQFWGKEGEAALVATAETGQYQVAVMVCSPMSPEDFEERFALFSREIANPEYGCSAVVGREAVHPAARDHDKQNVLENIPAAYGLFWEDGYLIRTAHEYYTYPLYVSELFWEGLSDRQQAALQDAVYEKLCHIFGEEQVEFMLSFVDS